MSKQEDYVYGRFGSEEEADAAVAKLDNEFGQRQIEVLYRDPERMQVEEAPVAIRTKVGPFMLIGGAIGTIAGIIFFLVTGLVEASTVGAILQGGLFGAFTGGLVGAIAGLVTWRNTTSVPDRVGPDGTILVGVMLDTPSERQVVRELLRQAGARIIDSRPSGFVERAAA